MDERAVFVRRHGRAGNAVVEDAINFRKRRAGPAPRIRHSHRVRLSPVCGSRRARGFLYDAILFTAVAPLADTEADVAHAKSIAVVARLRVQNSAAFAEVRTAADVVLEGEAHVRGRLHGVALRIVRKDAGLARAATGGAARLARVRDCLDTAAAAHVNDAVAVPALLAEMSCAPRVRHAQWVIWVGAPLGWCRQSRARRRAVAISAHVVGPGVRERGRVDARRRGGTFTGGITIVGAARKRVVLDSVLIVALAPRVGAVRGVAAPVLAVGGRAECRGGAHHGEADRNEGCGLHHEIFLGAGRCGLTVRVGRE